MQIKTWVACVLCVIGGFALGRVLPSGQENSSESDAVSSDDSRMGRRASAGSEGRVRPERRENYRGRSAADAVVLDEDSGLVDPDRDGKLVVVPATLIGELSLAAGERSWGQDLFSQDGAVEQYLQITDREKKEVQQAWRAAQKEMREYESHAAKTEDLEDGSVKITVPDMSLAMKGFGDDFNASVKKSLGENRADAFLQMKQVGRVMEPVEGDQVYTVRVEAAGDGRWRYHMSYESPEGRRIWVGESVPEEIRHLTDAAKINPQMNPEEDDED